MKAQLLAAIASVHEIATGLLGPVLDFIDARVVIRRAMILIVLWQVVDSYLWAKGYIETHPDKSGVDLGLVLAAVLTPVNLLMGFLYRAYNDARAT